MFRRISIAIALLSTALSANAGGSYIGRVKLAHFGTNFLYLEVSATQMSNRPACAVRTYVRLKEAPTDAAYKEKFSMLLGAWLADKSVSLSGNGTCTSEGDEVIDWVTVL